MSIRNMFAALLRVARLAMVGLILSAPALADGVRISTGEYAPWTSAELQSNGFVNHLVDEAFRRAGHTVEYTYLPWQRALSEAGEGRFDASSYWYFSEERDRDFIRSEPLIEERLVFFRRNDGPAVDWSTLDDLAGVRIGATNGYTYTEEFWAAADARRLQVDVAKSDEINFRKLLSGRIDLFPVGEATGWQILHTHFSEADQARLTVLETPLVVTEGFLLFPRANPGSGQLVADFNRGLRQLRNEGWIDARFEELRRGHYAREVKAATLP